MRALLSARGARAWCVLFQTDVPPPATNLRLLITYVGEIVDHTITVPPHWAEIEEVVCYVEAQLGIDTELAARGGFRAGGDELYDFHCVTDQPGVARALQTHHEDACRDARGASFRAATRVYLGAVPSLRHVIPVPPMQWLGRTDGEAELRRAPPAGGGWSKAIRSLLRAKPGAIVVENAGGGECGPLSLGYNGTRDSPGRPQTGERRADLVRFAR